MDKQKLSVSGLSSGGFFAVQFHVAFSKSIMGAGVVAGGKLLLFLKFVFSLMFIFCTLTLYIPGAGISLPTAF